MGILWSHIRLIFIINFNQVPLYNTHFASINTILICKKSFCCWASFYEDMRLVRRWRAIHNHFYAFQTGAIATWCLDAYDFLTWDSWYCRRLYYTIRAIRISVCGIASLLYENGDIYRCKRVRLAYEWMQFCTSMSFKRSNIPCLYLS